MTPEEFCIWLKGFTSAANTYNITPKQWDEVKEKLEMVFENSNNQYDIKGMPDYGYHYTTTIPSSMNITNAYIEYYD